MRYVFALLALMFGRQAFAEPMQLELKFQCQVSSDHSALRLSLLNGGQADTALVIGTSIGNGRRYVASSVVIEVKRSSDGPVEEYRVGGGLPRIAGRIDPWIVPLPVGSEFSLSLPTANVLSKQGASLNLRSGEIIIRAAIVRHSNDRSDGEMVGPGLVKVFAGRLQSAWLRAPSECSVG
jgi:hypothetical protein